MRFQRVGALNGCVRTAFADIWRRRDSVRAASGRLDADGASGERESGAGPTIQGAALSHASSRILTLSVGIDRAVDEDGISHIPHLRLASGMRSVTRYQIT